MGNVLVDTLMLFFRLGVGFVMGCVLGLILLALVWVAGWAILKAWEYIRWR